MIQPALQDDAFLADVASARADTSGERLFVWWLGQSGFLIGHAGQCVLLDPYLSDSLTRKYANTDKPHVRMTARVVDPARLDFLTAISSSHNHTDHLDADTLGPILAANPNAKLVLPEVNVPFAAARLGPALASRLVPAPEDGTTRVGPFAFDRVPAAHEQLSPEFTGFVVSVGRFRIYHSGDTILYPGMEERLRRFAVDLALLPINGSAPERRVAGNLTGVEAAELAKAIGARWAIPCHYDMFAFNTASPESFTTACARLQQSYTVLRAGERWVLHM